MVAPALPDTFRFSLIHPGSVILLSYLNLSAQPERPGRRIEPLSLRRKSLLSGEPSKSASAQARTLYPCNVRPSVT